MSKQERLTQVDSTSQVALFRMYALYGELEREVRGIKGRTPTAYIRIKKEFGITGSRNSVLRQFRALIEERKNA